MLEKFKSLKNLERRQDGAWDEEDAGLLLEGLYDEDCDCLSLAALDIGTVSGEVPPPAEELGG